MKRFFQILLVSTFAAFLAFAFFVQVARRDYLAKRYEHYELRKMAEFPKFSGLRAMQEFREGFDRWFSDHFAMRNALIRLSDLVRYYGLRTSTSSIIEMGKDGWHFLSGELNMESARHEIPFTEAKLNRIGRILEKRAQKLTDMGILYVLLIPPDTHTIYPEFLPTWAQKRAGPDSRIDQLIRFFAKKKVVEIVDLREDLLFEKGRQDFPLYQKTDTHWSRLGAFIGYRKLMVEIEERSKNAGRAEEFARPLSLADYDVGWGPSLGGDLSRMLGLQDLVVEPTVQVLPRTPVPYRQVGNDPMNFRTEFIAPSRLPRALVVRDSYFINLWPFVSQHFSDVHYFWAEFDWKQVTADHPDIVIEEIVERHFNEKDAPLFANEK